MTPGRFMEFVRASSPSPSSSKMEGPLAVGGFALHQILSRQAQACDSERRWRCDELSIYGIYHWLVGGADPREDSFKLRVR